MDCETVHLWSVESNVSFAENLLTRLIMPVRRYRDRHTDPGIRNVAKENRGREAASSLAKIRTYDTPPRCRANGGLIVLPGKARADI